ncbi:hypothetical protein BKA61DRAFT_276308 [Leptodontidium sp. MPI-SDFR-AT-0119]|nr:hypothetical protein BKA61DRAFT_276308 [Leptodontidium sp. MPI-SDFR-AT-0119]
MPRYKAPSDRGGEYPSGASTIDIDLPPPSIFFKKKNGAGKGFGKKAKTPPLPPIPPPRLPPQMSLLQPYPPHTFQLPILCCDYAKKAHSPLDSTELCHITSEAITPLLNNFLALGRETAYGRILDTTTTVEAENRFMVVIQKVETWERDMGPPRYFVPAVFEGVVDGDGDWGMLRKGEGYGKGKGRGKEAKASEDIKHHTLLTDHNFTRSLIEMEDALDETVLLSSPRTRALTPQFARTNPWSEDPLEQAAAREKVLWEQGQLGFREWVVTDGREDGEEGLDGGGGNGNGMGNVGVLSDWLHVEGRRGRLGVRCLECEIEWVVSVRERGLTI